MKFITTMFSPAMIKTSIGQKAVIEQERVPFKELKEALKDDSVTTILTEPLHSVLEDMVKKEIKTDKCAIKMEAGDVLYYVKVAGPRLDLKAKKLPEGNKIQVYRVTYKEAK